MMADPPRVGCFGDKLQTEKDVQRKNHESKQKQTVRGG